MPEPRAADLLKTFIGGPSAAEQLAGIGKRPTAAEMLMTLAGPEPAPTRLEGPRVVPKTGEVEAKLPVPPPYPEAPRRRDKPSPPPPPEEAHAPPSAAPSRPAPPEQPPAEPRKWWEVATGIGKKRTYAWPEEALVGARYRREAKEERASVAEEKSAKKIQQRREGAREEAQQYEATQKNVGQLTATALGTYHMLKPVALGVLDIANRAALLPRAVFGDPAWVLWREMRERELDVGMARHGAPVPPATSSLPRRLYGASVAGAFDIAQEPGKAEATRQKFGVETREQWQARVEPTGTVRLAEEARWKEPAIAIFAEMVGSVLAPATALKVSKALDVSKAAARGHALYHLGRSNGLSHLKAKQLAVQVGARRPGDAAAIARAVKLPPARATATPYLSGPFVGAGKGVGPVSSGASMVDDLEYISRALRRRAGDEDVLRAIAAARQGLPSGKPPTPRDVLPYLARHREHFFVEGLRNNAPVDPGVILGGAQLHIEEGGAKAADLAGRIKLSRAISDFNAYGAARGAKKPMTWAKLHQRIKGMGLRKPWNTLSQTEKLRLAESVRDSFDISARKTLAQLRTPELVMRGYGVGQVKGGISGQVMGHFDEVDASTALLDKRIALLERDIAVGADAITDDLIRARGLSGPAAKTARATMRRRYRAAVFDAVDAPERVRAGGASWFPDEPRVGLPEGITAQQQARFNRIAETVRVAQAQETAGIWARAGRHFDDPDKGFLAHVGFKGKKTTYAPGEEFLGAGGYAKDPLAALRAGRGRAWSAVRRKTAEKLGEIANTLPHNAAQYARDWLKIFRDGVPRSQFVSWATRYMHHTKLGFLPGKMFRNILGQGVVHGEAKFGTANLARGASYLHGKHLRGVRGRFAKVGENARLGKLWKDVMREEVGLPELQYRLENIIGEVGADVPSGVRRIFEKLSLGPYGVSEIGVNKSWHWFAGNEMFLRELAATGDKGALGLVRKGRLGWHTDRAAVTRVLRAMRTKNPAVRAQYRAQITALKWSAEKSKAAVREIDFMYRAVDKPLVMTTKPGRLGGVFVQWPTKQAEMLYAFTQADLRAGWDALQKPGAINKVKGVVGAAFHARLARGTAAGLGVHKGLQATGIDIASSMRGGIDLILSPGKQLAGPWIDAISNVAVAVKSHVTGDVEERDYALKRLKRILSPSAVERWWTVVKASYEGGEVVNARGQFIQIPTHELITYGLGLPSATMLNDYAKRSELARRKGTLRAEREPSSRDIRIFVHRETEDTPRGYSKWAKWARTRGLNNAQITYYWKRADLSPEELGRFNLSAKEAKALGVERPKGRKPPPSRRRGGLGGLGSF